MRQHGEELVLQAVDGAQFVVATLDLMEHLVEGDHQLADFVLAGGLGPNGVVSPLGNIRRG